jgi:Pregnancy-associated plasma protein-A
VVQPGRAALPEARVRRSIEILNEHFAAARLRFRLLRHDKISRRLVLPQLQENLYEPYLAFSREWDIPEAVTLYLVDNKDELCVGYSCSRSHGFAFVLSDLTNNVVVDKFFVDDHKTIVHEFGHYFGLLHTFDTQYGIENANGSNCATTGDRICDTPADPGPAYSVYVNPSNCDMADYFQPGTRVMYRPMINNFMSYYKPCYLKPYRFTQGQLDVIRTSALSFRRAIIAAP